MSSKYIIIYYDGQEIRATKVDLCLWPVGSHPFGLEDKLAELALPPQATVTAIISNEDNEIVHVPGSEGDYSSGMNREYENGHILYTTVDADKPTQICDRNAEVVLMCCRRCGKAEIDFNDAAQCVPCPSP